MRKTKALSLLASLALASMALAGTASASTPTQVSAERYPASLVGEGKLTMGVLNCTTTTVKGSVTEASRAFTATLTGKCNGQNELKTNGCKLEFNPYWGTYAIGPSGCGPMTVNANGLCNISIPSQGLLKATYETLEGTPQKVLITSQATGKYSGCGEKFSGPLVGSWVVSGSDSESKADGLLASFAAYDQLFEAESYPATLYGTQGEESNKIGTEAGKIYCTNTSFTGSMLGGGDMGSLTPTYSSCYAFAGLIKATITVNGCGLLYEGVLSHEMSITCPKEATVIIKAGLCEISIPAQSGLKGVDYGSSELEGRDAIALTNSVTGMTYTVTKDGSLCPFNGTGTRTDGSYTGNTLVQGKDTEGLLENIRAAHY
jgi:hypothetical protein